MLALNPCRFSACPFGGLPARHRCCCLAEILMHPNIVGLGYSFHDGEHNLRREGGHPSEVSAFRPERETDSVSLANGWGWTGEEALLGERRNPVRRRELGEEVLVVGTSLANLLYRFLPCARKVWRSTPRAGRNPPAPATREGRRSRKSHRTFSVPDGQGGIAREHQANEKTPLRRPAFCDGRLIESSHASGPRRRRSVRRVEQAAPVPNHPGESERRELLLAAEGGEWQTNRRTSPSTKGTYAEGRRYSRPSSPMY